MSHAWEARKPVRVPILAGLDEHGWERWESATVKLSVCTRCGVSSLMADYMGWFECAAVPADSTEGR